MTTCLARTSIHTVGTATVAETAKGAGISVTAAKRRLAEGEVVYVPPEITVKLTCDRDVDDTYWHDGLHHDPVRGDWHDDRRREPPL